MLTAFFAGSLGRRLVGLFLLSLALRALVLVPVLVYDVSPVYDEGGYLGRAKAMNRVARDLLKGRSPHPGDWLLSYGGKRPFMGGGHWPPAHPLLLTLGLLVGGGDSVASARIVVVLLSALTTPLVYLFARRLTNRKSAVVAALLHVFYPSFVFYGHTLWSETAYILFLIAALYFSIVAVHNSRARRGGGAALASGICLGLCGLTRSAALPLFFLIPAWVFFAAARNPLPRVDSRGNTNVPVTRRLVFPALMVMGWFLTILPWQAVLLWNEKHFTMLSSSSGYVLYLGNNPWLKQGASVQKMRPRVEKEILEYARQHGLHQSVAGRQLALKHIPSDVPGYLARCVERLNDMISIDTVVIRHFLRVFYPPVPSFILWVVIAVLGGSFLVLVGFGFWGLVMPNRPRHWTLIALTLFGTVFPGVAVISTNRSVIPVLAVFLPVAGHGAFQFFKRRRVASARVETRSPLLAKLFCMALIVLILLNVFPRQIGAVSSHYQYFARTWCGLWGVKPRMFDQVILLADRRLWKKKLRLRLPQETVRFVNGGVQEGIWVPTQSMPVVFLNIEFLQEANTTVLLELAISQLEGPTASRPGETSGFSRSQVLVIRPIKSASWHTWVRSEMNGLFYRWEGSGRTAFGE